MIKDNLDIKLKKIVVIGLSGESVFLSVDHLNKDGETIKAKSKNTEPGGKGYNQAVALGKLGADVSFITALGNDNYRHECIKVLKDYNVKDYIINKDIASSYAVIIVDEKANNNVIVYPGASSLVTFDDIIKYKNVIDEADIILIQNEYPEDVTKQIIDYCYSLDKLIVFNPAPKCTLEYDTLKKTTYLTPNEFELSYLKEYKDLKIVCTLGKSGVKYIDNNNEKLYDSCKVDAVDTTGAGDIFNAGFCYMISQGYSTDEAIKFAIACSGHAVTINGVIDSLPSYNDAIKLLKLNDKN